MIHESPHSWGDTSESVPWAVEVGPKLLGWTLGIGAPLECWPVDSAQPLKTFARNYYLLPLKSFPRKWKVHFQNTSHNQSIRSTQDQKPNVNSCLSFKFMRPICKDCQYATGLLAISLLKNMFKSSLKIKTPRRGILIQWSHHRHSWRHRIGFYTCICFLDSDCLKIRKLKTTTAYFLFTTHHLFRCQLRCLHSSSCTGICWRPVPGSDIWSLD